MELALAYGITNNSLMSIVNELLTSVNTRPYDASTQRSLSIDRVNSKLRMYTCIDV